MNWLLEDLRYAIRGLMKHRGFAWAALISLCLGIGANATIFTLIEAVLLRPLAVQGSGRLVALQMQDSRNAGNLACSYPNYRDYRDRNRVFSSLFTYAGVTMALTGRGDAQMAVGNIVSGNYFSALGVRMAVGRGFLPDEDSALNAKPVAVISYGFWSRRYGRDPRVTSRTLEVNGQTFSIVGVAGEGFQGLARLHAADIWVPMMMYSRVYPNPEWVEQRRKPILTVGGRLADGLTMAQAESAMRIIARDLQREYPAENGSQTLRLVSLQDGAIDPAQRRSLWTGGLALLIAGTLVLLIACANVMNLLLVRGAERRKEISVRLAMGAGRGRIIRQLLVESALLGIAGGLAGLLVAGWARDALWAMRPPLLSLAGVRPDMDGRVLVYAAILSLATGLVFGLAAALRATRIDLVTDLKERAGIRISRATRQSLVVAQLALSVLSLSASGLFVQSIRNAWRIDPGFDAGKLGIVAFNLAEGGYNETRGREFTRMALERARALPGVESVALSKDPPLTVSMVRTMLVEGDQSGGGQSIRTSIVSPGYFETMGIRLAEGREFGALDAPGTASVAIVNQAAAELYWPGRSALGRRVHFSTDPRPAEIIGVARNANYFNIGEKPQPMLYVSLHQYYFPTTVLYLRAAGDPLAAAGAARAAVQSLDRNLSLQSETVGQTIRQALWAPLLAAWLAGAFGALALALSAVGTYGVISYSVNQRRRELGVRMALGATPEEVRREIVFEGMKLAAAGVLMGLCASLALARYLQNLLFGLNARDPVTFVFVGVFLTLVALAASSIPAIRASRINPASALREE